MSPRDPTRHSAFGRGLTLALAIVATLVMIALTIPATHETALQAHPGEPSTPVHVARRF